MIDPLAQPLTLPCGARLPNRLCKAAMTEGMADAKLRATERHERLYRTWSLGGAGLLLSGNVMIDREVLERAGNVCLDVRRGVSTEALQRLRTWAQAGTEGGNHFWMQISHAGRQSPRYLTRRPLAPSAVSLDLLGNYARPRALEESEILDFVDRFARVAELARDTGFTGVQIHSAHGYLLSSFLSPISNQRSDAWGGSLENRARFLIETLRAVRARVGADFCVGLKLNSDDFRKGGFSNTECLKLVEWLNAEQLDLLEVSGGTYEQPRLLGFSGRADSAVPERPSTRRREAYFLDYARAIKAVATMPVMLTGGFRSRAGMCEAIDEGACDVIGLARPLATDPDAPNRLLSGEIEMLDTYEQGLRLGRTKWLSGASPILPIKLINVLGSQAWAGQQMLRLADGLAPQPQHGVLWAFLRYLRDELSGAVQLWRSRRGLS